MTAGFILSRIDLDECRFATCVAVSSGSGYVLKNLVGSDGFPLKFSDFEQNEAWLRRHWRPGYAFVGDVGVYSLGRPTHPEEVRVHPRTISLREAITEGQPYRDFVNVLPRSTIGDLYPEVAGGKDHRYVIEARRERSTGYVRGEAYVYMRRLHGRMLKLCARVTDTAGMRLFNVPVKSEHLQRKFSRLRRNDSETFANANILLGLASPWKNPEFSKAHPRVCYIQVLDICRA